MLNSINYQLQLLRHIVGPEKKKEVLKELGYLGIRGRSKVIRPEFKELVEKEGNLKEFVYRGFNCKIIRVNPEFSGHLCGYIEIPESHELHNMGYDEIEEKYNYELPAHGGLTFSGILKSGGYWIGFDCDHSGDLSPCYSPDFDFGINHYDRYMDMHSVEVCINEIVDFIKEENK